MPLFLREFISTHTEHGARSTEQIDFLMEKMSRTPPNAQDTITSKHYWVKYKELITRPEYNLLFNKSIKGLLEYILYSKAPRFASPLRQVSFCQQNLLPAELMVFLQAFIFEISDIGNCAHRSAYAALELHKIFQETPINVIVKSAEHVDQQVVYLGNKEIGYFVYDPLTNPEILFTLEEYSKTILTMFCVHQRFKLPIKVTITEKLCEQYQHIAINFREMLSSDLDKFKVTEFLNNPRMKYSLSEIFGSNASTMESIIEKAYQELKQRFGKGLAKQSEASEGLKAPSQSIFHPCSPHDKLVSDIKAYLKQTPGAVSDGFMRYVEEDRNYSLALRCACSLGNSVLVKLFMKYNDDRLPIDFNQASSNGKTPLVWFETSTASKEEKAEITSLIKEKMKVIKSAVLIPG